MTEAAKQPATPEVMTPTIEPVLTSSPPSTSLVAGCLAAVKIRAPYTIAPACQNGIE